MRLGSHLGGLQNLDVLVGSITLIVLSGDDAVVSPETEWDVKHSSNKLPNINRGSERSYGTLTT